MAAHNLDCKLEQFDGNGYASLLFDPVWVGMRKFGSEQVYNSFRYVVEQQLRLDNISSETYELIVKRVNGLAKLLEGFGPRLTILTTHRKKVPYFREELTRDEITRTCLRYAQLEHYLKKANQPHF